MKLAPGLNLGLMVLVGLGVLSVAGHAQGIPQGSYLDTCSGARVDGASLIATCHRPDGIEQHSSLINYNRCVGDIANDNGTLTCHFGSAAAAPPPTVLRPNPVIIPAGLRCDELQHEAADLGAHIDQTADPLEHARLVGRLQEVHDQEDRCAP
jgi:hypothetical protein